MATKEYYGITASFFLVSCCIFVPNLIPMFVVILFCFYWNHSVGGGTSTSRTRLRDGTELSPRFSSLRAWSQAKVFFLKLLSNMTYPHCAMLVWQFSEYSWVRAHAVFWLDNNNNRKLFQCFNEDLPKTALVFPTVLFFSFSFLYYYYYSKTSIKRSPSGNIQLTA